MYQYLGILYQRFFILRKSFYLHSSLLSILVIQNGKKPFPSNSKNVELMYHEIAM